MSCEYRIFYPLASSGGVATDFNLLDARDLHQLQANAATDSLSPLVEPERTDVYLLDDSMAGMCRYGLKLRGSAAAFDLSSPAASTWALELKVRKSPAPATDEMTDSSSHAATAASVPEDWKKVVRASITCAPSGLLRAILTEVESSAASRADKPQLHAVLTALARDLRDKVAREAAAAVPVQTYRFVSVSKRRTQLPTIGAEQTDVEVRVLPSPDVPVDVSSAAPLRFRSICFEGSRETLTDARIEGLFRHIAQRYPNSDAARTVTAAPRTMGAIVAGYPEFLLRCLAQANVSSSATAAAASSTSVAASASDRQASASSSRSGAPSACGAGISKSIMSVGGVWQDLTGPLR